MHSLASLVQEAQQDAEGMGPDKTVRYMAWYYGFHPLVSWVLTESVRQTVQPKQLRQACEALLRNRDGDKLMLSAFWCAWARIQLAKLTQPGEERQKYLEAARRNTMHEEMVKRQEDVDFIIGQIAILEP